MVFLYEGVLKGKEAGPFVTAGFHEGAPRVLIALGGNSKKPLQWCRFSFHSVFMEGVEGGMMLTSSKIYYASGKKNATPWGYSHAISLLCKIVFFTLKYFANYPNGKIREIWYDNVLYEKYVSTLRKTARFREASCAL